MVEGYERAGSRTFHVCGPGFWGYCFTLNIFAWTIMQEFTTRQVNKLGWQLKRQRSLKLKQKNILQKYGEISLSK